MGYAHLVTRLVNRPRPRKKKTEGRRVEMSKSRKVYIFQSNLKQISESALLFDFSDSWTQGFSDFSTLDCVFMQRHWSLNSCVFSNDH